jgi:hypothetical protein
MKPLKILFYLIFVPAVTLLVVGFVSTAYQLISRNVICCRGSLGGPIGFWMVFIPLCVVAAIVKLVIRKKRR